MLAANLRKAFSGIVTGNVKENGVEAIEKYGPYKLTGDPILCDAIDDLLQAFIKQHRMKLRHADYRPCYEINAKK